MMCDLRKSDFKITIKISSTNFCIVQDCSYILIVFRDGDEKSSKGHSSIKNDKERERKLERERSIPDHDRDNRLRDSDWSRDGRQEKKGDPDTDWNMDRSDSFERERVSICYILHTVQFKNMLLLLFLFLLNVII